MSLGCERYINKVIIIIIIIIFKQFTYRQIKSNSKSNLLVNLFFSLIVACSSDTTYSVPGIASHTFMFSFRLAISLKNGI